MGFAIGIGNGLHLRGNIVLSFEAEYQAVLDYATTQGYTLPSASQKKLQNQLVKDLKKKGVWSKLDAFSVFATNGNSDFALVDWVRLVTQNAISSPIFTTNQGFKGDLVAAYIDLGISPASATGYAASNASLGAWYNNVLTRTDDKIGYGTRQVTNNKSTGVCPFDSNRLISTVNDDLGFDLPTYTPANGYFIATRDNPASYNVYLNGSLVVNELSTEDTTMATENFYCLAFNAGSSTASGFSDDQISALHLGQNLTATEVSDLSTAVSNYIKAI